MSIDFEIEKSIHGLMRKEKHNLFPHPVQLSEGSSLVNIVFHLKMQGKEVSWEYDDDNVPILLFKNDKDRLEFILKQ